MSMGICLPLFNLTISCSVASCFIASLPSSKTFSGSPLPLGSSSDFLRIRGPPELSPVSCFSPICHCTCMFPTPPERWLVTSHFTATPTTYMGGTEHVVPCTFWPLCLFLQPENRLLSLNATSPVKSFWILARGTKSTFSMFCTCVY